MCPNELNRATPGAVAALAQIRALGPGIAVGDGGSKDGDGLGSLPGSIRGQGGVARLQQGLIQLPVTGGEGCSTQQPVAPMALQGHLQHSRLGKALPLHQMNAKTLAEGLTKTAVEIR